LISFIPISHLSFSRYGSVKRVIIDRTIGQALVFYAKYEHAQKVMSNLRGRNLNGSRLKLDYASHELVELFLTRMQRTGMLFCIVIFSNVNRRIKANLSEILSV